jgi:hypothetical protein
VLELADLSVHSAGMDGRSLLPLIKNTAAGWRNELLIEGWKRSEVREPFKAVRTADHVYVEYASGDTELYDLREDPFQLHNRSGDLTFRPKELELVNKLELLSGKKSIQRCHDSKECLRGRGAKKANKRALKIRRQQRYEPINYVTVEEDFYLLDPTQSQ